MPEAEQELTAGYHVEYSGMKFALFMLTEYTKMIVVSAIAATLFLGGYHIPFVTDQPWPWLGPVVLFVKIVVLAVRHYLGARHPAPHPLRPADGAGLEDYAAARSGQCVPDGSRSSLHFRNGSINGVSGCQRSIT